MPLQSKSLFIIAEIGQAHNGSLSKAHDYIDAVAATGVHAIKFQVHIADAESSIHEPFRIAMNTVDMTRFDYWKRMEFTTNEWKGLRDHCMESGLEFMASPFSNAAVDILEELEVKRYKIGSGEVTNFLLLQKIALTGKPVILSSGMSSYSEMDKAHAFLISSGLDVSILQCTTSYPTTPDNYGLNVIDELKKRYGGKVGFSDHSARIETAVAAVALGAEIIEFHVILDNTETGPDASSSLTIAETTKMVKAVTTIFEAINQPVNKEDNSGFENLKNIFEKSLAVNKDLKKGHIITFNDLESKKPKGYGIDASLFQEVLGKPLQKDKARWDFLTADDIIF